MTKTAIILKKIIPIVIISLMACTTTLINEGETKQFDVEKLRKSVQTQYSKSFTVKELDNQVIYGKGNIALMDLLLALGCDKKIEKKGNLSIIRQTCVDDILNKKDSIIYVIEKKLMFDNYFFIMNRVIVNNTELNQDELFQFVNKIHRTYTTNNYLQQF